MWSQTYDPLNAPVLSALVAASPIILFLLCLTVFKLSGIKSALITLVLTPGIALGVFRLPVTAAAGSILYGFLSAFWPIGWIVLMAVWLYRITVRSGKFAVVRASVSSISPDQRIQVLLIALCFAGFIEGAAGFGIPIAISVALLVALGFNPLKAAMLSLVANATVGAYGAVGIPVTTWDISPTRWSGFCRFSRPSCPYSWSPFRTACGASERSARSLWLPVS